MSILFVPLEDEGCGRSAGSIEITLLALPKRGDYAQRGLACFAPFYRRRGAIVSAEIIDHASRANRSPAADLRRCEATDRGPPEFLVVLEYGLGVSGDRLVSPGGLRRRPAKVPAQHCMNPLELLIVSRVFSRLTNLVIVVTEVWQLALRMPSFVFSFAGLVQTGCPS